MNLDRFPQRWNNPFPTRNQVSLFIFAWGIALAYAIVPFSRSSQGPKNPQNDFSAAVSALSTARQNGSAESEEQLERALVHLDDLATAALNSAALTNLDVANRELATMASEDSRIGENYRLFKLGQSPAVYGLAANFGLGGPAAVRIYAGAPGHYALAAKIDRFVQDQFFDSDVEFVPAYPAESLFVTVSGRTDDLSTGMFSAWRFDGQKSVLLWSSDLLQQSSYEMDEKGFHLTYCSQPEDEHPAHCLKMTRELYRSENGEWKKVESVALPEKAAAPRSK
jgi:hypothetical protein